jgi:hypothetical protein
MYVLDYFENASNKIHFWPLNSVCHITGPDRLLEFQEVEAPEFPDNCHMKVVTLSAPRTGRL